MSRCLYEWRVPLFSLLSFWGEAIVALRSTAKVRLVEDAEHQAVRCERKLLPRLQRRFRPSNGAFEPGC